MMNNYSQSLERKRVDENYFEDYYYGGEKAKIHDSQKNWIKTVIKKEELRKILKILSPFRISKILGVSKQSIIRVAEEYSLKCDYEGGHYITISNLIRKHGKESKFYEPQRYWLRFLMRIGKFYEF